MMKVLVRGWFSSTKGGTHFGCLLMIKPIILDLTKNGNRHSEFICMNTSPNTLKELQSSSNITILSKLHPILMPGRMSTNMIRSSAGIWRGIRAGAGERLDHTPVKTNWGNGHMGQEGLTTPKTNKKLCFDFNAGHCTFGKKCRFDHRSGFCGKFGHGTYNCRKAAAIEAKKDNMKRQFNNSPGTSAQAK